MSIPDPKPRLSASSKTKPVTRPPLEQKILFYLQRHPKGLSDSQMRAWLDSCRKGGGYTMQEQSDAIRSLRDRGWVTCTNGLWWLRKR